MGDAKKHIWIKLTQFGVHSVFIFIRSANERCNLCLVAKRKTFFFLRLSTKANLITSHLRHSSPAYIGKLGNGRMYYACWHVYMNHVDGHWRCGFNFFFHTKQSHGACKARCWECWVFAKWKCHFHSMFDAKSSKGEKHSKVKNCVEFPCSFDCKMHCEIAFTIHSYHLHTPHSKYFIQSSHSSQIRFHTFVHLHLNSFASNDLPLTWLKSSVDISLVPGNSVWRSSSINTLQSSESTDPRGNRRPPNKFVVSDLWNEQNERKRIR